MVLDEKGRWRGTYYTGNQMKLELSCRFEVCAYMAESPDLPEKNGLKRWCMIVLDEAQAPTNPGSTLKFWRIVFNTAAYDNANPYQDEQRERECVAWLRSTYPDHKNPFAYWSN